jgi:hypothetical protein
MEIVVMLVLVSVVGAMIISPLVRRDGVAAPESGAGATAGAAGPNAEDVLADLEFDHATGKLADDDYEVLRSQIRPAEPAAPVPARAATDEALDALEAEIRAARAHRRFCAACGAVLPKTARFCPACGAPAEGRA